MTWHESVVWMLAVVCAVGWWDAVRWGRYAESQALRSIAGWEREQAARLRLIDVMAERPVMTEGEIMEAAEQVERAKWGEP